MQKTIANFENFEKNFLQENFLILNFSSMAYLFSDASNLNCTY